MRKREASGSSGLKYEVDIVHLKGNKYILIDGSSVDKILPMVMVSYDLNIPPLLLADSNTPKWVEDLILWMGGKIVRRYELYS